MSLWVANRDNNEYIFTEGLSVKGDLAEEVMVGAEKYYRNIIKYSDNTFYVYTAEKLKDEDLKTLENEWIKFYTK